MRRKIELYIEERINPFLKTHKGLLEVVDLDNNILIIKLNVEYDDKGKIKQTLLTSIKSAIQEEFPQILKIIEVSSLSYT